MFGKEQFTTKGKPKITQVTENDLKDWAHLRHELWPSQSPLTHLKEIQNLYGDEYSAWLLKFEDQYCGFAEASIRPFANGCVSTPVAFLEGIWVDSNRRGLGLSHELLSTVQRWAISKGMFELGSDTELTNTLSQECHQKWGFQETERVIYYSKRLK